MQIHNIYFSGKRPSPDLVAAKQILQKLQKETPGASLSIGRILKENGLSRDVTNRAKAYAIEIGLKPMDILKASQSRAISDDLAKGKKLLDEEVKLRKQTNTFPGKPVRLTSYLKEKQLSPSVRESLRQYARTIGLPCADPSESRIGKKQSLETRQKKSKALKGRKMGPLKPETKAKISKSLTGRLVNDVTREKIKEAGIKRAEANPDFFYYLGRYWKDKKRSPETRQKLSAIALARTTIPKAREEARIRALKLWQDPEIRQKTIEGMNRRWHDPAQRIAKSRFFKNLWADPEFRERMMAGRQSKGQIPKTYGMWNKDGEFIAHQDKSSDARTPQEKLIAIEEAEHKEALQTEVILAMKKLKAALPEAFIYICLSKGYSLPGEVLSNNSPLTHVELAHYFNTSEDSIKNEIEKGLTFLQAALADL